MGIEIAEKRGISPKEYRASIAGLDEMDFMAEVREGPFLHYSGGGGCLRAFDNFNRFGTERFF